MENIEIARYPFPAVDRRQRMVVLTSIVLLHAILICGWTARKRAAPAEEGPMLLPIWNISQPQRKTEDKKTVVKQHEVTPHAVPRPARKMSVAPQAVPQVDQATVPPVQAPAPATAEPTLDYDAIRSQALDIDKHREISPIEKLRQEQFKPHTVESGIQDAARRGKRADCQTAYAGAGLLAVVPLLIDTVTDHGCKWN